MKMPARACAPYPKAHAAQHAAYNIYIIRARRIKAHAYNIHTFLSNQNGAGILHHDKLNRGSRYIHVYTLQSTT